MTIPALYSGTADETPIAREKKVSHNQQAETLQGQLVERANIVPEAPTTVTSTDWTIYLSLRMPKENVIIAIQEP